MPYFLWWGKAHAPIEPTTGTYGFCKFGVYSRFWDEMNLIRMHATKQNNADV